MVVCNWYVPIKVEVKRILKLLGTVYALRRWVQETGDNTSIERLAHFVVQNMAEVTQKQQQVRLQNLHCYD